MLRLAKNSKRVDIIFLKKQTSRKGQMSLEMIIGLIILLVVAAVVIKIFMDKMGSADVSGGSAIDMSEYEVICNNLCQNYVNTMSPADALSYCEKYFPIDLNEDGKTLGEAGILKGFGVCETRVYCMNIQECSWGPSTNSRLTPEKCRDIMCDVYTDRMAGEGEVATDIVRSKMMFGSCGILNEDLRIGSTTNFQSTWFTGVYSYINCSEHDYVGTTLYENELFEYDE